MPATTQPEIVYERPWLYDRQREFVDDQSRYVVVEASTKVGKTVSLLVWIIEQAMAQRSGRNVWWVAPVFSQSNIAYTRLKTMLANAQLDNGGRLFKSNDSDQRITLRNGVHIWFKSGEKPDNLYGEDVYAAVVDEASRMREESWHAIRSTLTATRGKVRLIGNVRGRKNWMYHLARKAEAGERGWGYYRLTAWDAVAGGVLDREEVEDAQRTLPAAVFSELYLAEPSDDEGNPFGITAIRDCVTPLSTAPPIAWGVDLAKSIDWTVCIGLDAEGRTCRFDRWQSDWRATERRILDLVGSGNALVDSTGVGDPVLEQLQAAGSGTFEGLRFSSTSKQQLMEGLAVAIQQGTLHFPEGPIVNELEAFEYVYSRTGVRYSAPEGLHDDCVMALALARDLWARSGSANQWIDYMRGEAAKVKQQRKPSFSLDLTA